jgi:hypothetical protein
MESDISFIPVLLIVTTGISVVTLAFTTLRKKAAITVAEHIELAGEQCGRGGDGATDLVRDQGLSHNLLLKVLKERRMIAEIWRCTGVTGDMAGVRGA